MSDRLYRKVRGGTWYGWYYEPDGRRVRVCTRCLDKRAARAVLRKLEVRAASGNLVAAPPSHTLRQTLEHLVLGPSALSLSDATIGLYRQKAGHLLRVLGETRDINALHVDDLDRYIGQRLSEGVQPETVRKELATLRRALRLARKRGLFGRDPADVLPELKPSYRPRERWLDEGELAALLAAVPASRRLWVLLAALAGLRKSEVEGLDWQDVGPGCDWIAVRGTKTREARRIVPCAVELRDALAAVSEAKRQGPVAGRWLNVLRDLAAACRRAGIEKATPNDLRRSFASALKRRGVDTFVAARLMGHASTTMIERVYGRLDLATLAEAIGKMPRLPASGDKGVTKPGVWNRSGPETASPADRATPTTSARFPWIPWRARPDSNGRPAASKSAGASAGSAAIRLVFPRARRAR